MSESIPTGRSVTRASEPERTPRFAVELKNVVKAFDSHVAVDDCSLSIREGEFVSLLGPSGCGKTTLLRMIGGFTRPDTGSIHIGGTDMTTRPPNRRPVNTVFQSYALFPNLSVLENVMFPLRIDRRTRTEAKDRASEMLDLVQLSTHHDRTIGQLSGGQAQRVALARALAARPSVLLLDEPLSALDSKLRLNMQRELRRIQQTLGTTFIFVTHDQSEALTMSDRVVLMNQGRVVQDDDPRAIYDLPESSFASDFLGAANLVHGTVSSRDGTRVRVDCGPTEIDGVALSDALLSGEDVVVSIRPEAVSLLIDPEHSRTRGTVTSVVFAGNTTKAEVDLGQGIVIAAETSSFEANAWEVGSVVGLSWRAEHARVFSAQGDR